MGKTEADPTVRDAAGENALHIAINGRNNAVCELLMARDEAEKMMLEETSRSAGGGVTCGRLCRMAMQSSLAFALGNAGRSAPGIYFGGRQGGGGSPGSGAKSDAAIVRSFVAFVARLWILC